MAKKPSIEIGATDVHDQVGGESFASKILSVDGVPKAGADLSIYEDKVYIQHVQTLPDAQRQGYAKQLIDNLIEEHPDKKIALTLMTGEGEKFFSNTYDIADDMTIAAKKPDVADEPDDTWSWLLEGMDEGPQKELLLQEAKVARAKDAALNEFIATTEPAPTKIPWNLGGDPDRPAYMIITPSVKEPGRWQGTTVDQYGPSADINRDTYEEVIRELADDYNLDITKAEVRPVKEKVEPPRRSLLERLAEGVEDPGALERGRLEVGDKVLRPDYDEDHHDKLLRQLNEALANNDTEAIKKGEDELAKMLLVEPVTPEIESQRISQLAALDALEPVEKARLDRAVEQGFDLDAFHGTKGDIEAFDPGLLGETTNAPSARLGFFFSADAKTAETYAEMARLGAIDPKRLDGVINSVESHLKDGVIEKKQRINKLEAEISDIMQTAGPSNQSQSALFNSPEVQKIQQEINWTKEELSDLQLEATEAMAGVQGQNIMPVKLRLQNPLEYNFEGNGYRDTSYRALLENAKNRGHDGAIFRNTTDGSGVTDIYVVFEPAQIRSRFAAFDPKAPQGTGDIAASFAPVVLPLGAGTAAAAYLANQEQD